MSEWRWKLREREGEGERETEFCGILTIKKNLVTRKINIGD